MNDRPGFVPANTPPPIPGYESLWPGVNMGTALSGLRAQKVQLTPQQDARLTKARNLRYLKWVLNLVLIGFVLMTIGGCSFRTTTILTPSSLALSRSCSLP